jgi:hypothetical protein
MSMQQDVGALADELERALGERPVASEELHRACEQLREGFRSGDWRYDLLAACTRTDPRSLPDDDMELWLTLARGVVRPTADPPHPADDDEAYADWHALTAADWFGAALELTRQGPGAPADAEALATYAATSSVARELRGHSVAFDTLAPRFRPADVMWRALRAIDSDARLTELGAWGIPAALVSAWRRAQA